MNLFKGVRWNLIFIMFLLVTFGAIIGSFGTLIIINEKLEDVNSNYKIEFRMDWIRGNINTNNGVQ